MDSDTVKANEKLLFNHFNNRDMEALENWIDEFVAEDIVTNGSPMEKPVGREGLKDGFRELCKSSPDITITIEDLVFENDIICFRHITHPQGIGTDTKITGLGMAKFKDGKIAERWVFNDAN